MPPVAPAAGSDPDYTPLMMPRDRRHAGLFLAAGLVIAPMAPILAQDPAAQAAGALERGRPWHATQLLRPVLADQTRASPRITLLAARAAAAWGGWSLVQRLLGPAAWADAEQEAPARELLGRAALDRRGDAEALDHLRVALRLGPDPRSRGVRHTLLARSFDRLDQADSAATHYRAAATLLPAVADWLLLRAAGVTSDGAERQRLYQGVRLGPARPRVAWTEAATRTRFEDHAGASAQYAALGARVEALQARFAAASTDSARSSARRSLTALLNSGLGAADARAAVALLDALPGTPSAAEQLAVARRAASIGDARRAVRGFVAAREGAPLNDQDRHRFGMALAQLGRHAEAIAQFETVRDRPVAAAAAYQRARSILARSGVTAALPALRRVPDRWPTDTASAGVALFLAGDLLADQGDFTAARESYRRAAADFPTSPHAARALLEVGTLSWALGEKAAAAEAFSAVAARYPEREEGSAGAYWAGRAEADAGDRAAATARWRTLIATVPHSYYALAAATRLGELPWAPGVDAAPVATPASLQSALARAALLDSLGFEPEVRWELDHLVAAADTTVGSLVVAATALAASGHAARATALAQRALARGAPRTRSLYRLLFPIPEPAVFAQLVAERALDPWLVAGLIKQESGFNPRARSGADARGLMQVMPAVGAQIARRLGWTEWDEVLLYQPEVSLTLGTLHLKEMIQRYPDPIRFLAAYNAGGTRVRRWDGRPGVLADPELYLEQIPYIETRNYVRRVLRNAAFYRAMYGGER
jgi:soluble lytic murein transglycosylase